MSHTIHIAAVAYNSVFLGEIMQPDWDMFHSLHRAGEYHASARAISGGPIYVRYVYTYIFVYMYIVTTVVMYIWLIVLCFFFFLVVMHPGSTTLSS